MGLVGGSSLSTSSSACFSLSFFFFFFLTGSLSSTVVSSVPQKEEKLKAGCQLLRVQKAKGKAFYDMQEDATMIVRMQNTEYHTAPSLHLSTPIFFSTLPSPAWLFPAIIKIYNYLRHKWQCSDSTIHISWYKHHSYMLIPKFKTSLHVFICLPNYLQVLFLKTDRPQFGKYFHQHHKSSGRTPKPTLEMRSASSSLFATDFPILMLKIC